MNARDFESKSVWVYAAEGADEEVIQMIEAIGARPEPEALRREEDEPENLDSTPKDAQGEDPER